MSRIQSQYSTRAFWRRAGGGLLVLIAVLSGRLSGQSQDGPAAGFFFDRYPLALDSGTRTEVAGPLYYHLNSEMAETWALPPFFSRTDWLGADACEYDFAYPLLTYDRFGSVYRWQLGQLFAFAGGDDQSENARDRFTLFPFYFQQRSPDSNQNYTALFPLYGHLKNRIFRSEIDFLLWPLYVKTVKRPAAGPAGESLTLSPIYQWLDARRGDVTTYNFLLPIFHIRHGDGLFGWQAWPLLGHEHKDVTTKTNSWGDAEQIPGHDKLFFAWPFFLKQNRGLGSTNPESQWLLFPLYNRLRSPQRDSTSYLTPFGLTLTDDRARQYRELDLPWPFVVFAWGEGKTIRRIWPLFSQAHTAAVASDFYLWPLYTHKGIKGETLDRQRYRLLYFLYSRTVERNTETRATKTRTDLWPLFTQQRGFDGRTRLQILAPLEPILPASKSIDRNYSPLWSLWRSESNPQTGAKFHSFLWNLYRHEVVPVPQKVAPPSPAPAPPHGNFLSLFSAPSGATEPAPELSLRPTVPPQFTKKGSLLFGLFQYESTGENRRWRLFYLPLNPSQKVSEHVPEHR